MRAFCDNAYRLVVAIIDDRPPASFGSLASATAKPSNPVAKLLADEAPDVLPWFSTFRARRNEVKEGVNFSFTALGTPGVAITFNTFRSDSESGRRSLLIGSSGDREVPFATVIEDVRRLTELAAMPERIAARRSVQ